MEKTSVGAPLHNEAPPHDEDRNIAEKYDDVLSFGGS